MKYIPILLLAGSFIFVGCNKKGDDPVSQFKDKHPKESSNYIYIYPVNMEMFQAFNDAKTGEIVEIGSSMKEKFKDIPDVVAYADTIIQIQNQGDKAWKKSVQSLRDAGSKDGAICLFKWRDRATAKIGFLVLKSGDIVKEIDWSETITGSVNSN
jgi:hypothetical protein